MIATLLIGLTILFMLANLWFFFTGRKFRNSHFHPPLFQKLFYSLGGITFGFAVLYQILGTQSDILRIATAEGEDGADDFWDYLYFSGTTMLSVGYGDIVPVGSARFFSLVQAAIGLLLPAAYFAKVLTDSGKQGEVGQEEAEGSDKTGEKQD
ncbi:potassium channel family protein [Planococcus sp. ISL-109]|uniref:potassium channel family protein n=1 Tax=Planococcus sp. ISL-109 TaxID=2819166 RepID=UPI001BE6B15B|nr:potassium channel family protein [Planococcus sp. ISL-109]MBT2583322.1 two pore domain potassium channel family protein [Planococcus sp. ISL-109]